MGRHGQGTIRRRGDRFEAAVMIGKRRVYKACDSRADAVDWLAQQRERSDAAPLSPAAPYPVAEVGVPEPPKSKLRDRKSVV